MIHLLSTVLTFCILNTPIIHTLANSEDTDELPHTAKPVLGRHPQKGLKLVFKTDNCSMQVKSIAECSLGAPREHSAILSTCIKLPSVCKIFVMSIFEWPLKTRSNCNVAFHQGLHHLLLKVETIFMDIIHNLEIPTCDPLKYILTIQSLLYKSVWENQLAYKGLI